MKIKIHLLGTSIAVLLSVYAVTAYAGQGIRIYTEEADVVKPEIRYPKPDGNQDYYQTNPHVYIYHRQCGAVTKYEFLGADNTKKTGSLELMEGQMEECFYLAEENFKDGENILRVWMERIPRKPGENEEAPPGENEAGGNGTEENGTEENGTEENGTEENETEESGTEEIGAEENETDNNESEGNGMDSNESEEYDTENNASGHHGTGEDESGKMEPEEQTAEQSAAADDAADTEGEGDPVKDDTEKDDMEKGNADTLPDENELPGEPEIVFDEEFHFLVDTKKPQKVLFSYNKTIREGAILTNEPVELTVTGEDEGSGIESICYKTGDGAVTVLPGNSGTITLFPGFAGSVEAYAVDKAGNQSESVVSERILSENTPPAIRIEGENGIDTWYSGPVSIRVIASDDSLSAGLRSLKCYAEGEILAQKENDYNTGVTDMEAEFTVDIPSKEGRGIPVTVEAQDWAGNYYSESRSIYIDNTAPAIRSEGVHDRMIAGKPINGKIIIREENDLASAKMEIRKITSDNKKVLQEEKKIEPEPFSGPQELEWNLSLAEDGNYEIYVTARDRAGQESSQTCHIILDQTNPVIRYVDQMQGVYVPYFQWNYGKEEVVQDETEYSYDIFLDGTFYTPGTRITKEGPKMLQIRAVDAAGNESSAEAVFQIDHTPPKIRIYDVEDGNSYKDGAAVSISVDGKGEYLKEIRINSEKMRLDENCQIFTQSFQESGDYQIQVLAEDLAGNQEREQITFCIEEQKQLAGGVWKPITKIFRNQKQTPVQTTKKVVEKQEKSPAVWLLMLCFAMVVLARVLKLKAVFRGGAHE